MGAPDWVDVFPIENSDIPLLCFGYGPLTVTVTTRIITFLVGGPYTPSFATVTGRGPYPSYVSLPEGIWDPDSNGSQWYCLDSANHPVFNGETFEANGSTKRHSQLSFLAEKKFSKLYAPLNGSQFIGKDVIHLPSDNRNDTLVFKFYCTCLETRTTMIPVELETRHCSHKPVRLL